MVEGVEDVVGKAGQKVNDEPRLEIIDSYHFRVRDDLAGRADVGRVKVQHDVDEEDDVDDGVDDEQRHVLRRLVLERDVVRHHDGRVEGQAEDDPVPDGFEGTVVKQNVRGSLWGLLSILRQNIGTKTHQLEEIINQSVILPVKSFL